MVGTADAGGPGAGHDSLADVSPQRARAHPMPYPTTCFCSTTCARRWGSPATKTGCDGGGAGPCTVLVDGAPVLSCLTLSATVAGRSVETVESLAEGGRLAFIQEGFQPPSSAPSADTARRGSSWPRKPSCGRTRTPPKTRSGRRSAATSAAAHRLREDHRSGALGRGVFRRPLRVSGGIPPMRRPSPRAEPSRSCQGSGGSGD